MPQKSHATISKQALATLMEEYEKKRAEKEEARQEYAKAHPEDSKGQNVSPRKMRDAGTLSRGKAEKSAMVQRKTVNENDPDTDWTDAGQQKRWGDPDEYGKRVASKKAKKK